MTTPAQDLALLLKEMSVVSGSDSVTGLGGVGSWPVSVAAEADAPDDVVTLYDTGGREPDTEELDLEQPFVQVRVRSRDYFAGYAKQIEIRDALTSGDLFTAPGAGGARFVTVAATSDVASIGRDDSGRHVLVANYRTIRQRS